MDTLPTPRPSNRAHRGAHTRTKGEAPWWERMGEAPPGAATRDGATRRRHRVHPGLVAGAVLALMALPLLAFTQTPSHNSKAATQRTPATRPANVIPTEPIVTDLTTIAVPTTDAATSTEATTTTTEASTTTGAKASTTAAKPRALAPAAAAKPAAKPASAPAPAPKPTPAPSSGHSQSGQGTWYNYKPGGCANNDLPMGTVVHVTNTSNGRSTSCVVNDTGGFRYPRILDMDEGVFSQIADPGAGVIPITISW